MNALLMAGLILTPLVNWPVFFLLFHAARTNPGIRSLIHMRWLSFGIGLLTSVFAVLVTARLLSINLAPEVSTFLVAAPVYLMTAINGVFLWLTLRGRW